MLLLSAQTSALALATEAVPGYIQWAPTLLWLCLAALLLFVALWLFRRYVSATTGRDPKEFLMNFRPFKGTPSPQTNTPGQRSLARQARSLDPLEHPNVRSNSISDSRSGGPPLQRDEVRALLREVVQEELSKLRSEISNDLQGSLRAIADRIDKMQVAPIPAPIAKTFIEPPTPRSVQRAVTENELLAYWRALRDTNQVSAWHIQEMAAKGGATVVEAPGLNPNDPLHRLGFLLTDGRGTIWFIPRPAFQRSELQGVYNFPANSYLPGAISDVVRFAQWQGGQIVTPGEAN